MKLFINKNAKNIQLIYSIYYEKKELELDINILMEYLSFNKINNINKIQKRDFFIDTIPYNKTGFIYLYPSAKKLNITHDLLNLYGTHWRYKIELKNLILFYKNPYINYINYINMET